jgi:patatin-like phospholipase/acyl hydrolase
MPRRQILCISGGGYAGLFAAKFLALLESESKDGSSIASHFDGFAGTSVGGMLALGFARGKSAKEVLSVMQDVGTAVFPKKRGGFMRALWGPKYDAAPLRSQLHKLLGMGRLATVKRPVLVTAVDLANAGPRIFRGYPNRSDADGNIPLSDVALATSAAPIFFAPHRIGNTLFVDGGLVANVPDQLAILEAIDRWGWQPSDIYVLSIGTTHSPAGLLTHSVKGWGIFKWGQDKHLLDIAMSAQMALATDIATRLLPANHLVRIDPPLGPEQGAAIGLDVSSVAAKETLQALAQQQASKLNPLTKNQFLGHLPGPIS